MSIRLGSPATEVRAVSGLRQNPGYGRTTSSVDDTAKLNQEADTRRFDQPAVMRSDLRPKHLFADRLESLESAFLVYPHQPRIARDIGSEDRSKAAGLAHVASPAARRRPDKKSSRCSVLRR